MKRKDLIVIVMAAVLATLISVILSNIIFGSPKKNPVKVPVVDKINSTFPSPQTDEAYRKIFNNQALDPTQLIHIGGNPNPNPFNDNE